VKMNRDKGWKERRGREREREREGREERKEERGRGGRAGMCRRDVLVVVKPRRN
jgi:hypothetical protein